MAPEGESGFLGGADTGNHEGLERVPPSRKARRPRAEHGQMSFETYLHRREQRRARTRFIAQIGLACVLGLAVALLVVG